MRIRYEHGEDVLEVEGVGTDHVVPEFLRMLYRIWPHLERKQVPRKEAPDRLRPTPCDVEAV